MTRHVGRAVSGGHHAGPQNTPRLRMKPKARMSGHVDGAWWPHSDDLPRELPNLLAVLSVRLGSVERVMYDLAEWANAPRRLATGGRSVRLDGFRHQPANTLDVRGVGREGIRLLVVPPSTDPDTAHKAMMTAAAPGNVDSVVDMLGIGGRHEFPAACYRPTLHGRARRSRP
ncbi:DUF5994 family protein [Mycobacterium simiae]|uniref:DUF5994 family protein n=1 Tax=Mycobacterium simiae TaxID=1784 RepID=UPI0005C83746|nr:DUF5994 family protein [Mycobacterium simiae]PLV52550.1 hypothetical protein X011_08925 [Mycobacterium tuberculosis variant microti OV254]BBX40931.1 hypothetical protein MSIM_23820 [Mycobacterium simiae]